MIVELEATRVSGPMRKIWSARSSAASFGNMWPPKTKIANRTSARIGSDWRLSNDIRRLRAIKERVRKIGGCRPLATTNSADLNGTGSRSAAASHGFGNVDDHIEVHGPIEMTEINERARNIEESPVDALDNEPSGEAIGEKDLAKRAARCASAGILPTGWQRRTVLVMSGGLIAVFKKAHYERLMIKRLLGIGIPDIADGHRTRPGEKSFCEADTAVVSKHGLKPTDLEIRGAIIFSRAGRIKLNLDLGIGLHLRETGG